MRDKTALLLSIASIDLKLKKSHSRIDFKLKTLIVDVAFYNYSTPIEYYAQIVLVDNVQSSLLLDIIIISLIVLEIWASQRHYILYL